jgi:hypothetical protein
MTLFRYKAFVYGVGTSIALLAVVDAAPASALDWQVRTKTGQEVLAHSYTTGVSRMCRTLGLPKISFTARPTNGSVDIRKASAIRLAARRFNDERNSKDPCVGLTVEGLEIYYMPHPDFHGTDRISYEVAWPGRGPGSRVKDTVTIDVQE